MGGIAYRSATRRPTPPPPLAPPRERGCAHSDFAWRTRRNTRPRARAPPQLRSARPGLDGVRHHGAHRRRLGCEAAAPPTPLDTDVSASRPTKFQTPTCARPCPPRAVRSIIWRGLTGAGAQKYLASVCIHYDAIIVPVWLAPARFKRSRATTMERYTDSRPSSSALPRRPAARPKHGCSSQSCTGRSHIDWIIFRGGAAKTTMSPCAHHKANGVAEGTRRFNMVQALPICESRRRGGCLRDRARRSVCTHPARRDMFVFFCLAWLKYSPTHISGQAQSSPQERMTPDRTQVVLGATPIRKRRNQTLAGGLQRKRAHAPGGQPPPPSRQGKGQEGAQTRGCSVLSRPSWG